MRGGYIVHGPHNRDYSYTLPRQVRKLGLRIALSAKFAQGDLTIVDGLETEFSEKPKTKQMAKFLGKLGVEKGVLIVGGESAPPNIRLSSRNLPGVLNLPVRGANVYDILKGPHLVIEKKYLEALSAFCAPVTRGIKSL